MKVSLLVPCYNEEKSLRASIASWLAQSHPLDEIIVVDDCSTDSTPAILAEFAGRVKAIRTPENLGNKSHAQQYGLQFVTGEVVVTTDGDTQLDSKFVETIIKDFDVPTVGASGGYVKSLKHNWLTRCRALDYAIGQNIHKLAQSYIDFMFVIPGAAGAFRTDVFRQYLSFDHDTLTEDLDFTYKLHKLGYTVKYNREAIVYTQDPSSMHSYINQIRRWYGGGWQNLRKHWDIARRPVQALELSLMYVEGLTFSALLLVLPLINIAMAATLLASSIAIVLALSTFAAIADRRADLLLAFPAYLMLTYVNAYIFLEQFFKEIILGRKNLTWFQPERVSL